MDEVDKKIVAMLQKDGRVSLSRIAKQLGLSHVAVGKRIEKLCRDLVKVSAGINAKKIGFRVAIVNAEVESPEILQELLEKFSKCPRIVFLTTTTGAYNLMSIMIAEDADTLDAILQICSIRSQKGIRRSEAIVGETPKVPEYLLIPIVDKKEEDAPCGINCGKCARYKEKRCLGCPATIYYHGPL